MLTLRPFSRGSWPVDSAGTSQGDTVLPQLEYTNIHFHCAQGFATLILAYMLDSLVRVSRRVGSNHFLSIPSTNGSAYHSDPETSATQQAVKRTHRSSRASIQPKRRAVKNPQSHPRQSSTGYNMPHECNTTSLPTISRGIRTDAEIRNATAQRSACSRTTTDRMLTLAKPRTLQTIAEI